MADGYFPTLVSKDANVNAATNPLYTQITDGTDVALIDASGNLQVLVGNGAAGAAVNIQDGGNSITVDGTVAATQSGTWNIGTVATITNPVTVTATNLDIRDLAFATDKVDVSGSTLGANSGVDIGDVTINNGAGAAAVNIQDGGNSITVDGSVSITGSVTVTATALDIRPLTLATDAVKISGNTSANSAGNPIYVALGSGPITGEVHSYNTASVTTTDNHDYTVVTAMLVKSIEFAASGGAKVELQVGPVASLVSKWVGFVPKAGGNVSVKFDPPIEVPVTSTGTVRLVRTNRENQAQSLYSTIVGIDA